MTVAQQQEAAGISVGAVAGAMHVSSSFVTAETGKLSSAMTKTESCAARAV
jgi:hypothetical protein